MSDLFETINANLDKNNPNDAGIDLDGDGLTNLQEFQNNTDPNNPNSDGDGFNDGREVAAGTDPNDPDSFPSVENETPASIPTLSEWGLIVLIVVLILIAAYRLRCRRVL